MKLEYLVLLAILPCLWSQQIPTNARQKFAIDFFTRVNGNKVDKNFVISTGSLHKWLAFFYCPITIGADYYLYDLKFKFDLHNFAAKFDAWDVINYFRNDFREVTEGLKINNFLAGPMDFKKDIKDLATEFFNIKVFNQNSNETKWEEFEKFKSEHKIRGTDSLQIYSWINIETNFKNKFNLENGKLHGVGSFRYGRAFEFGNYDVIELPLNTDVELTLMILMPEDHETYFKFFYAHGITRDNIDEFDENLKWETVEVILPEFKFENVSEVNWSLPSRDGGYKQWLTYGERDYTIFDKGEKNKYTKIECFWQKTTVNITPLTDGGLTTNEKPTKTFDASNKSFYYFIKSQDVLYFMGTRFVPEN